MNTGFGLRQARRGEQESRGPRRELRRTRECVLSLRSRSMHNRDWPEGRNQKRSISMFKYVDHGHDCSNDRGSKLNKRSLAAGVLVVAILFGATSAAGATTTSKEHKNYGQVCLGNVCSTFWGVKGKGDTIDRNKQVQVYSDRFLAPDPATQWFTETGIWFESGFGYTGRRGSLKHRQR